MLGEIDQCAVEKLSCGADTCDAAAPGGVSLRQGKPSENVANGRQADPAPVAEMWGHKKLHGLGGRHHRHPFSSSRMMVRKAALSGSEQASRFSMSTLRAHSKLSGPTMY